MEIAFYLFLGVVGLIILNFLIKFVAGMLTPNNILAEEMIYETIRKHSPAEIVLPRIVIKEIAEEIASNAELIARFTQTGKYEAIYKISQNTAINIIDYISDPEKFKQKNENLPFEIERLEEFVLQMDADLVEALDSSE